MKNVLIIGKGYIGRYLYKSLGEDTFNVTIISKRDVDYSDVSNFKRFLMSSETFNYVINCSGFTGIPNIDQAEVEKADCWKYNVNVPINISKVCKQLNIQFIHISTGCIYSGYDKEFTEEDIPNFGMFDTSSFYSKTKHAYELQSDYGMTIRIRMPYCDTQCSKNFISKIISFNNICDLKNSKTYINDLSNFLKHYITSSKYNTTEVGLLNLVNPDALYIQDIVDILTYYGLNNPNWTITDISKLNLAAPRSNCVLSTTKLTEMFPNFKIQSEKAAIINAISTWHNKNTL